MKTLKRFAASLTLALSLSTPAFCLSIPWEHVSGYKPATNGYGVNYSYGIQYIDNALRVDVGVFLWGDTATQTLLDRWETGIESVWSTTTRFAVPILFNVDWVGKTEADRYLRVVEGPGRWNSGTFYTVGVGGWGDSYTEEAAAHEFGHWISLFDEYLSGGMDPSTMLHGTGGLMETLNGGTLAAYYEPFLDWYEDHLPVGREDPVPTPEPSTIALWLVGLAGVVVVKERQSV